MTKVHPAGSTYGFRLACTAVLLLGLTLAACESADSPAEPAHDRGRFGDAYQVLMSRNPDGHDEPPAITSDSIYVQVSYTGGCENHDFELDVDTSSDTTRLWLHHSDGGDKCEETIYERLGFEMPERALSSSTILFLNPNYGVPIVVGKEAEGEGEG